MKKLNPKILDKIFSYCEKNKFITEISPDHYKSFLDIEERSFKKLCKIIIRDRANILNVNIKSGKIKNNDDVVRFVMDFLEMMAQGIMLINEDLKLCFTKPIGPSISPKLRSKLMSIYYLNDR